MLKFLGMIASFFSGGGVVASFFAWIGAKFTSKAAIVGIQISTIILLFSARIAFLLSVLDFAIKVFNLINDFLYSLNSLFNSDSILSLAYKILRSVGVIDGFMDAFAIFNVLTPMLLLTWALKFAYHTSKMTSDEFFKLGVLIQE